MLHLISRITLTIIMLQTLLNAYKLECSAPLKMLKSVEPLTYTLGYTVLRMCKVPILTMALAKATDL